MRRDTPLGPVWIVTDALGEKAAKHYARLELAWPDIDGFVAMHAGPSRGGVFLIRAPREALEKNGYPITSAAELPVREGTAWPPLSEEGERILREQQ